MQLGILGVPYQLRRALESVMGAKWEGRIFPRQGFVVVLDDGGPRAFLTDGLVHELVHAVDINLHLALPEETITRLGKGLYAILADNSLLAPIDWDSVPWLTPEETERLKEL